jgi:hypothetical protein
MISSTTRLLEAIEEGLHPSVVRLEQGQRVHGPAMPDDRCG